MLSGVFALLLGYVIGSIPSGVIITRLAGATDPRGIGSKNIGATNVLRTGRKDLAAATLLADALKGTIAVLLARTCLPDNPALSPDILAAAGAFLGHLFPVFLGFKGGKGVATFLGVLIGLAWPAALAFAIIWIGIAYFSRYSSAAALSASSATPVILALMHRFDTAVLFAGLAALLWWKHRSNISRLLSGEESKIGQKGQHEPVV